MKKHCNKLKSFKAASFVRCPPHTQKKASSFKLAHHGSEQMRIWYDEVSLEQQAWF